MDIEKFGATANGLAKNPLGIIALFIVLVYGIAGLVLGTTVKVLGADQRTILTWFLFLFPFAVLATFGWLVARYPKNLYAPSDYRSDEAYLQSLDAERQAIRLEEEVQDASGNVEASAKTSDLLEEPSPSRDDVLKGVVLSEDLALREIEGEFGSALRRQVAVGDATFDAMFSHKGSGYGVEVKYVPAQLPIASIMRQLEAISVALRHVGWHNFRVILALVVEGDSAQTESRLPEIRSFAERVGLTLEIKMYQFGDLRQKYRV